MFMSGWVKEVKIKLFLNYLLKLPWLLAGSVRNQGGHSFLNSLNSMNCSWIFLVLQLFLKNTMFWLLFLKCPWKVIFVSDAHKVYSFIQLLSLDKKSYVSVLNNIWLKFVGYNATYKWCAILVRLLFVIVFS